MVCCAARGLRASLETSVNSGLSLAQWNSLTARYLKSTASVLEIFSSLRRKRIAHIAFSNRPVFDHWRTRESARSVRDSHPASRTEISHSHHPSLRAFTRHTQGSFVRLPHVCGLPAHVGSHVSLPVLSPLAPADWLVFRTFHAGFIIAIVVGLGVGETAFGRVGSASGH